MKIRYLLIGLIIILCGGYYATVTYLFDNEYTSVNMEDINDRFESAKSELIDENVDAIEEKYNCEIALIKDEDYQTTVYNAILNQKILLDYMVNDKLCGKFIFDGQGQKLDSLYQMMAKRLIVVFIVIGLFGILLFVWIYMEYIKPFRRLEQFATQICKGNLDFPLYIQKHNYFGAFTESFDIMREELKQARAGEYAANQSKKELVASLSHDIKTPVSTIKAICEILLLKVKEQATLDKVLVINQKADVIDTLISNMFHATMEELSMLKIIPNEELSTIIPKMFEDINHEGKIHFTNTTPECLVIMDALRLNQVIDNVINNSYKYANTDIEVGFVDLGDSIAITIRDYGKGINKDELPLITEKFYRGKNVGGKDGSGLGLYLSKQFMEGMKGEFSCENVDTPSGFLVILTLKRVSAQ